MSIVLFMLVIGCIYIVAKVAIRIYNQYQHVDDDVMRAFISGKLREYDSDEYRRVISHLGLCNKCQEKLNRMTFEDTEDEVDQTIS